MEIHAPPQSSPPADTPGGKKRRFLLVRLAVLMAVLFVELMVVSLSFDAYLPRLLDDTAGFGFLAYAGQFAKFLVVVIVAFTLAVWPRFPAHFRALSQAVAGYRYLYLLILQLIAFVIFYIVTARLFGVQADEGASIGLVLVWLAAMLAVAGLWLFSMAPWRYWQNLLAVEYRSLLLTLVVGGLAWWVAQMSQELWGPLSEWTFHTSAVLLSLIYPDVIIDPQLKNLGTYGFVVNIAPACSGYEGIGLVTIFTAFYLSVFRSEFRFPQAWLLFPIGIVTIWLFNAVRIVILIALGSSVSEDIALGGFHSQAGWISFIVVTFCLLMLAHKLAFFTWRPVTRQPLSLPAALLIPFIAQMAATIVTSALSADFDWLYPLRVVATAIALGCCWKIFSLSLPKIRFEPIAAGVLVFVFWVPMIANDMQQNRLFAENLFGASVGVTGFWLVLRLLGAVITVPLAEELVFRGYLLSRLTRRPIRLAGRVPFSWLALLGTSVLFGMLHSAWVAGTLAGLVYGLVRYRSNSVVDAVIAHGVTNLLLSILVLSTGWWSLW